MKRISIVLLSILLIILAVGCSSGQQEKFNKTIDKINKQTDQYNNLTKKSNEFNKEMDKVTNDEKGAKQALNITKKTIKVSNQMEAITQNSINEILNAKKLELNSEEKTYLKMLEKSLKTRLSATKLGEKALSKIETYFSQAIKGNVKDSLFNDFESLIDKADKLEGQAETEFNKADDYHSKNLK